MQFKDDAPLARYLDLLVPLRRMHTSKPFDAEWSRMLYKSMHHFRLTTFFFPVQQSCFNIGRGWMEFLLYLITLHLSVLKDIKYFVLQSIGLF